MRWQIFWQVKKGRSSASILDDDILRISFDREYERWGLWVENLGLFNLGHSSLDYRLRDADSLSGFVRDLLRDLCKVLDNCKYALSHVNSVRNVVRLVYEIELLYSPAFAFCPTLSEIYE